MGIPAMPKHKCPLCGDFIEDRQPGSTLRTIKDVFAADNTVHFTCWAVLMDQLVPLYDWQPAIIQAEIDDYLLIQETALDEEPPF